MRVVLDANVILAAFGFRGICRSVLDVCLSEHEIVISEYLLQETHRHLQETFGHTAPMADERVALIQSLAIFVKPSPLPSDVCRDPNDVPVLGTVIAGQANALVTGDRDLLDLKEFAAVPIMTPRQFWESLRANRSDR